MNEDKVGRVYRFQILKKPTAGSGLADLHLAKDFFVHLQICKACPNRLRQS
jgi:hypothetical protein